MGFGSLSWVFEDHGDPDYQAVASEVCVIKRVRLFSTGRNQRLIASLEFQPLQIVMMATFDSQAF